MLGYKTTILLPFLLILFYTIGISQVYDRKVYKFEDMENKPEKISVLGLYQDDVFDSLVFEKQIAKCINLNYLQIETNKLTNFPSAIYELPMLDTIVLDDDEYTCPPLYRSFHNFKHLQCIMLNTSNMNDFPENLINISTLSFLHINAPNIKTLPKSIKNFGTNLVKFSLILPKVKEISPEVFQINSLRELYVISKCIANNSYLDFNSHKELRILSLEFSQQINFNTFFINPENSALEELTLVGVSYTQFPKLVFSFKKLKKLDISVENLSSIDSEITQLNTLEKLVIECKTTPSNEDIQRIKTYLPKCEVKIF